jgi:hypothetical protein
MWQRILDYLNNNNITALPTPKGNCVIPQQLEDRNAKGKEPVFITQFEDINAVCASLLPLLPEGYKCEVSEPSRRYPEPCLFIGKSTSLNDYTFDKMV